MPFWSGVPFSQARAAASDWIHAHTCSLTPERSAVSSGATGLLPTFGPMLGFSLMNSGSLTRLAGFFRDHSGPGLLLVKSVRSSRYDWVSALATRRGVSL